MSILPYFTLLNSIKTFKYKLQFQDEKSFACKLQVLHLWSPFLITNNYKFPFYLSRLPFLLCLSASLYISPSKKINYHKTLFLSFLLFHPNTFCILPLLFALHQFELHLQSMIEVFGNWHLNLITCTPSLHFKTYLVHSTTRICFFLYFQFHGRPWC